MKKTLYFLLFLILFVLLLLGGRLYYLSMQIPSGAETVRLAAIALKELFGVTPVCHDRTLSFRIQETKSLLELTTVSRLFTHHYRYSTTWMGSTKYIDLVGTYEAKAGIDLNEVTVEVSLDGKTIDIYSPPAQLHSFTRVEEGAIMEDSGLWNRVTSQDKEIALRKLQDAAMKTLLEGNFLEEAESRFADQIKSRLAQEGVPKENIRLIFEAEGEVIPVLPLPEN